MAQQAAISHSDAALVSEAYATARELLRLAEEDAGRIRAEAERYVRQREQEAELLVAKARRMLAIAEEKAAAMLADPPRAAVRREPDPRPEPEAAPGIRRSISDLDAILANAIGNAVHRALPAT
jgi:hypothetical protein